ncbi:hypothetical protein EDC94DRAFT_627687 [Helicostylum pulchrum]|uniref:BHLH domain-containing protein n=1 Tax=Helicostylum pulchrum TaxID=562976 RepID=A0ABP9YHV0_9FUNG|nr:hypothetical protein EDC94DRAFT_627687 [Helicostylum pulchrum]
MSNYSRQTYNSVPMLHDPPVVYGNLPQQYYPIMQYHSRSNIMYQQPQIYYQNELMVKRNDSPIHNSPPTPPIQSQLVTTPLTPPPPPPSTEDRVKKTIARANAIPAEFYQTEFLEYSKKSYDFQHQSNRKRKRAVSDDSDLQCKKSFQDSEECLNTNELRRQIHIQSEQKRRAQIKDGFDILKSHLPGCNNKKLSKAALLTRTVQQLEHMKKVQSELLAEVERLVEENANLKMLQ